MVLLLIVIAAVSGATFAFYVASNSGPDLGAAKARATKLGTIQGANSGEADGKRTGVKEGTAAGIKKSYKTAFDKSYTRTYTRTYDKAFKDARWTPKSCSTTDGSQVRSVTGLPCAKLVALLSTSFDFVSLGFKCGPISSDPFGGSARCTRPEDGVSFTFSADS
ncbi:MAG: hypothetical protein KDC46_00425 [Thermoleophilia bacterium]|nr:hypothetical protein [Thermoleophilia bacterium]